MKKARIQIRIDPDVKKIERAAQHSRKILSEFVVSRSLAAAEELINDHEKIILSDADWDVFYNALVRPPKPNRALQEAYRQYVNAS